MNSIKLAFRKLFRKGEHTYTRIISLALGLTFGILLLSEVLYYYSFDSFYPYADRTYIVHENFKLDKSSDKLKSNSRVSGAIAPGMKLEVPGIEAATRLNSIGKSDFYTDDKKAYSGRFSMADEYLFNVLPRPVISGNPQQILKTPMNCMISDKIAKNMNENPVGKIIELKEYPGKKLTIAGIFKALPENTNYKYDVLISMSSMPFFFSWDGSTNWLGNDRYYACVRLAPGVRPENLTSAVRKMQVKNQDIEKLEKEKGVQLKYSFVPIKTMYSEQAKDMILIMSLIAFAVLFVALMNYILLTVTSLVNRAKSSAIHKACGAETGALQKMIFSETSFVYIISLVVVAVLILLLKPFFEAQVGHKFSSVFNPVVIIPLVCLLIILLFAVSYFPGRFYANIPVASAFRSYRQKGSKWKIGLLAIQFIGASFIFTVLAIVTLQYNKMMGSNHGYNAEDVYYASTSGIPATKVNLVMEKLRAVPEIEQLAMGSTVPVDGASGNNVMSIDKQRELFNIADQYWIDENYLSILGIKIVSGEAFKKETPENQVLISQKGADKLILNNGWKDGVVGKEIFVTEHNDSIGSVIAGVYPDFIIESMSNPDMRPSAFFYMPTSKMIETIEKHPSFSVLFITKARKNMGKEAKEKMSGILNSVLPYNDAVVKSLAAEQENNYMPQRGFKNALISANIIVLILTFIGLIGYTTSEVLRRRKDLAIRRINGASIKDVLSMFALDLQRLAIPAVFVGIIASWFLAGKWMQNFAIKIQLHWLIFLTSSLFILLIITLVAIINYARYVNKNPVEALRYE